MNDEPEELTPPRASQLSKTPSWVMLGFVLGAIAVYSLPRPEKKIEPPPAIVTTRPIALVPPKPPTVERWLFFESVFAEWSKYARWENEVRTEVAFWNAETKSFSDRFEVYRIDDKIYFRSITRFTRVVLTHGVPSNSPLQFTETQAERDEWLRENSAENVRQFFEAPAGSVSAAPEKP